MKNDNRNIDDLDKLKEINYPKRSFDTMINPKDLLELLTKEYSKQTRSDDENTLFPKPEHPYLKNLKKSINYQNYMNNKIEELDKLR